ncbi:hypothetical protein Cri9333_0071 [Crinalium epipsammum PCC 9333]|uniref:General stress protein 17M-like domain-containing protein n=1 Tax=Crinalium epipsammum PCC 9333 TaxID=1173022 RepID=K9VT30_9CYAN|nr:general stress protein [Crinalium epipsammum]AFZ11071.1 hypothetical protein Cri9333_0071 [Crinalium epipsammum PCC 9333]
MALGYEKRAVGVFSSSQEAQDALAELRDAGFPMSKVSVIAKDGDASKFVDSDVRDADGNKADDGAKTGAATGGALGGLTGLLVGLGAIAIPGIGPVMLAGAAATAIATTLSGAAIGAAAGGIIGSLVGLGIPEERATVYNERVNRGHYLVMLDGTEDEIRRAEAILSRRGVQEWGVYDIPNSAPIPATHTSTTSTTVEHEGIRDADDLVVIVDKRDEVR